MNFAIILAAGTGSRFGSTILKQKARLAGKPVYEHTLEKLQISPLISGILLVTNDDLITEKTRIKKLFPKVLDVIKGGSSRLESSYAGLRYLAPIAEPEAKIIIHDAVRPFLDENLISRILDALNEYDAVDPVIDATDTIICAKDGFIDHIPDRRNLKRGQTPQGFKFSAIIQAYERAFSSGGELLFSDDCGVFLKYSESSDPRVKLVAGCNDNIKITLPLDMSLAEAILRKHQFIKHERTISLEKKRIILLGGHGDLGEAVSNRLKELGADVHSLSRRDGVDIKDIKKIKIAFSEASKNGDIDAIVNLAGILKTGEVISQSKEDIHEMIDTNLIGAINVAQASYSFLKKTKGQLLYFSSSSYMKGRKGQAIYAATKAALSNFIEGLSAEWEVDGIRVNCVAPSRSATKMRSENFKNDDLRDLVTPEQIAIKVEMILSTQASGMTFLGTNLPDVF